MASAQPLICISVCEESITAAQQAINQAGPFGDLIEIRLDCMQSAQIVDRNVERLFEDAAKPTILTYRPMRHGGHRELSNKARLRFWLFSRPATKDFIDMEFDLVRNADIFEHADELKLPDWDRVICSQHDFSGRHAHLDHLYTEMAKTPARILKIAVRADDAVDCLPVFQVLERARREGRKLIAVAMGPPGIITRILGPSRGSFLTYAALNKESVTAPGQITARELRETYRIHKLNRETEIFGLVGLPVSHSVSANIHNEAFESAEINGVYVPFEVRDLPAFLKRMVHPATREIDWKLRGLSVTAPHKFAVMDHLDWIEPGAKSIGAVNTILINEQGLNGYNTDALGFLGPLVGKMGKLRNARCAVIGAGGAASAAVWALSREEAQVTVFARRPDRATSLAKKLGVASSDLEKARFDGFDVVVNATTLGTTGLSETETPATAAQLRGARLAYDLVYNPIETLFLREASEVGCETLGGLPMLVAQAAEQFKLWTGKEAPVAMMHQAGLRALQRDSEN